MNTLYFNDNKIWSSPDMPTKAQAQMMLTFHAPSTIGTRGVEEAAENITIGIMVITVEGVFRWELEEDQ